MHIHTLDYKKDLYNLDVDILVPELEFLASNLKKEELVPNDVKVPKIRFDDLEGKATAYGYRVVRTEGNSSLGLRKNPHVLHYPENEWFHLPKRWLESGNGDWGGIWVCRMPSQAKTLQKYMDEMYGVETRAFKAYFGNIMHFNDYRIKTDSIRLDKEIFF